MGRRNRERIERISKGLEQPIARKAVAMTSRRGVVRELSKGTVSEQTDRLDALVGLGTLPANKLRDAIVKNAPKEMDKAIKKFRKKGKEITVDSLLVEVRSEGSFMRMCERVGITYQWFTELAKERMRVHGV